MLLLITQALSSGRPATFPRQRASLSPYYCGQRASPGSFGLRVCIGPTGHTIRMAGQAGIPIYKRIHWEWGGIFQFITHFSGSLLLYGVSYCIAVCASELFWILLVYVGSAWSLQCHVDFLWLGLWFSVPPALGAPASQLLWIGCYFEDIFVIICILLTPLTNVLERTEYNVGRPTFWWGREEVLTNTVPQCHSGEE